MSVRLAKLLSVWLCGWLWLAHPIAVQAQYNFDHWTTEQGLPHNNVGSLAQTPDGYLWLGTADGLARFDGVRFTVFNTVNTPGMSSNRINCLFVDGQGALWIGTDEAGVVRYWQHRFTPQNEGLPDKRILRVDADEQGAIWIYTDKTIGRYEKGRFVAVTNDPNSPLAAFSPSLFGATGSVRAGPWLVNESGLQRFAHGRVNTIPFPEDARTLQILDCWEDCHGNVWINSGKRGTYRYRNGQLTWIGVFAPLPYTAPMLEDRRGRIWTNAHPEYLSRWEAGQVTTYPLPITQGRWLNLGFFEDREGTLWLSSMYAGLFRLRPRVITSVAFEGISSYPLYQDRQQDIWLTTTIKYSAGKFIRYSLPAEYTGGYPTTIFEDHDGTMLLGTEKVLLRLHQGRMVPEPFQPGAIYAMHRDTTGVLWAGSEHGLYRLEPGPPQRFTRQDGLATEELKVIIPRRDGGLWIGGYGGLTEYRAGRFAPVPLPGLPSDRIRALYEDADGTLWIGTYDGGLGRWKHGKLTSYTTQNGLFNDGAFQILEDRFGYFWLSCNRGIYRVRKDELTAFAEGRASSVHCTNYNRADGMLNEECNGGRQPGGFIAVDGKLWFPTQNGAAVVDPAAVATNSQAPPVTIEECRVDNKAASFRTMVPAASQLAEAPASEEALRLEPAQSNLEIQYTGLSLIKSEQINFRYRLLGLDDQWTEAGTRRTAYFSHLPPGTYTFQVIAANSDGLWNTEGARLKIIVVPPFYRTWWFLTLVVTSIGGLVGLAYQYRVRQLTRAKDAQEAFSQRLIESQEHERKRIAAELHDSLGQNLLIIKNRALLGALSAPEPSQHQFNEISASVGSAIEEVREIAYNLRPYHLDRLGLTQTIEAMIERVAETTGIEFTTEVPPLDGLFDAEAEINFYRVLQECVNNIARHSQATAARVAITRATHALTVTISDNGRGFSPEALSQGTALGQGGFGLSGIAERVRLLKGVHTVESAPGLGTTFTLKLNLA